MRTPYTDDVNSSSRPTFARIDLGALTHNFQEAARRAGNRTILAVVKAQAYGHGAIRTSRHLLGLGAGMLGVALVEEAQELREAGIKAPVLVMGAIFPGQAEAIVASGITPVVYSEAIARALSAAAKKLKREIPVHVKIDTGMGRLGILPEKALDFITAIRTFGGIRVEGLMTHFADADLQDKRFASWQMERFEALIKGLAAHSVTIPYCHAANSAAVLDYDRALFTMVRPGLMLYGYNPLEPQAPGRSIALKPVLSLVSQIAFLKKVPAGTPISYGRTFTTERESLIATVPIGYADGYPRSLSNRGQAIVRGTRVRVVGRVCMDMLMLDVTAVPDVSEHDEVVLIGTQGGEQITAEQIAMMTGTIPYEILCGISGRVPRTYR